MHERGFDAKKDQTMRLLKVVMIVLAAMVTQSCKITMPSLIKLLSDYNPRGGARTLNPYNFSKSKALQMQAGFKDTLIVGDDPESRHGMFMNRIITYAKIPQKNIVFFERLGHGGGWRRPINLGLPEIMSQEHEQLRKATKVVNIPS